MTDPAATLQALADGIRADARDDAWPIEWYIALAEHIEGVISRYRNVGNLVGSDVRELLAVAAAAGIA